jgi:hypothetical protein
MNNGLGAHRVPKKLRLGCEEPASGLDVVAAKATRCRMPRSYWLEIIGVVAFVALGVTLIAYVGVA